jgi:NAD-dependent dihydropyrimidine dehydrogenase PreA subunit
MLAGVMNPARNEVLDTDTDIPNVRCDHAFDEEKARRAAKHPRRPGERCRAEPSVFLPKVDWGRCEGKADCVAVCPYSVFEVRTVDDHIFQTLPVLTRLKLWVHGKKAAFTPRADACQACGLCVVACPEKAVTLIRMGEAR